MTAAPAPAAPVRAPWWSRTWAGALILLALIAALDLLLHWHPVAHWVTYWTGQDDEGGGRYGLWSGFGGALPDIMIVTAALGAYWALSCHQSGCWLPGRHPAAGGSARMCRWHHPDIRGRRLTAEVVAELHHLHLDRLARRLP